MILTSQHIKRCITRFAFQRRRIYIQPLYHVPSKLDAAQKLVDMAQTFYQEFEIDKLAFNVVQAEHLIRKCLPQAKIRYENQRKEILELIELCKRHLKKNTATTTPL